MRISSRRCALLLPGFLLACSIGPSNNRDSSSSSGGGCGGGGSSLSFSGDSDVKGAPDEDSKIPRGPQDPAPTGQSWKPVATDEHCGRSGVRWILVDEVCDDGAGNENTNALHAPMFRDGAIVGGNLFAVDATHLWSLDLAKPLLDRSALLTGIGQPLAVDKRGTELVMAAGTEGLVLVNAANPGNPYRSRSAALAGNAFDVQVAGDKAYVALGSKGFARVDLASGIPTVERTYSIGGFSAGVTTRDGFAYVASCTSMRVVDLGTGAVVGSTWVDKAVVNGRLVAPAKKVTLVGNTAFVAAGRYGAVAVDVTAASQPKVLGNYNTPEVSFYASGVRANADQLFIAGGEYGILTAPLTPPPSVRVPAAPTVDDSLDCSTKPPWEVLPWESVWAPPPPRKDPVQVLPVGDRVYAFGDARRIGTRAVDVRDAKAKDLTLLDRFDEPRALLGVATNGDRVVAVGEHGGVFSLDADGNGARVGISEEETAVLRDSKSIAMLGDGRWVAAAKTGVRIEGAETVLSPRDAELVVAEGNAVALLDGGVIEIHDAAGVTKSKSVLLKNVHLPVSFALDNGAPTYAAPEWTEARRADGTALTAHGVFDAEDILDVGLWRMRLPRRQLVKSTLGMVEVAGLGPVVSLALHGQGTMKKTALPPMTVVGAAADGARAFVIGIDRNLYRSTLVSVDLTGGTPKVVGLESFTGGAAGIAAAKGKVVIADADGRLRTYRIEANGAAKAIGTVEVKP